jgi:hypothetical protein
MRSLRLAWVPAAVASWPAVSAVLSKPFDLDMLEAIVQRLTARRGAAASRLEVRRLC